MCNTDNNRLKRQRHGSNIVYKLKLVSNIFLSKELDFLSIDDEEIHYQTAAG